MNIVKRVRALLNPPERALRACRLEFEALASELEQVMRETESDALSGIVSFFSITSRWHDRGLLDLIERFSQVNDGQYDEIIGKLTTLHYQFVRAGRDEFGWNRTKHGEEVVPDKVYLGNIYGLFTHPVPVWQEGKDKPKSSWPGVRDSNPYEVVSAQARNFVQNHAPVMAQRARELIAA